ncbi:MAG: DPP IV N-terminal domain-containing protein [bacterium]|jgi:dipeptidyl-peptidase-4|nr:MAG: peptidase [bacterium]
MRTPTRPSVRARAALIAPALFAVLHAPLAAQDRLRTMPGYERYRAMAAEIPRSVKLGALNVTWAEDGRSFEYVWEGTLYRYDVEARRATAIGTPQQPSPLGRRPRPERGRQYESAESPDGRYQAFYRDRNVWIRDLVEGNEFAVTTDGDEKTRVKYGTASWVYGEELRQTTAMWWSPSSRKLAFYRFDESGIQDYYLQLDQTQIQSRMDIEAYPKAGTPNPIVDVLVYDLGTRKTVRLDVRDGKPFSDDVVGHYVYGIEWTPDGREVLIRRTNRRQNAMELAACDPETTKCRVVVREEWPASWVENSPTMRFLADGKRFIWASERTGFRNYYLYDLSGKLLATLTNHPFEVGPIVMVDEKGGFLWYMARSGDNHMKLQLHRVRLDGRGDRRLTDPRFHHTVMVAPDGRHFVDVAQTHDTPPVTRLMDANGKVVAELAKSDMTKFEQLGLHRVELFTFTAADGVTELHGMLHRPSNFDPNRKWPVLVSVYAGPGTNGARETFMLPDPLTEFGFLVVTLDARSAGGRGKRFLDAIYQKLGQVEIDDLAAGVKALRERPYVDGDRVGIFGTSYGGYAAAMALVRYPDVFHAASASSPVTDWRNYDTIYTERYMWTPQGNPEGYEAGSVMKYVDRLRGRLMIYYGTADNNVHPSNAMQLIDALQRAGKSFEVQVGPDRGHTSINRERMMEFFIENLILGRGGAAAETR